MAPLAQVARWHGHPLAALGMRLGGGVDPLRPSFRLLESSDLDIFLGIFWIFSSTFIFHLFLQCMDKNRQKLALGTESVG